MPRRTPPRPPKGWGRHAPPLAAHGAARGRASTDETLAQNHKRVQRAPKWYRRTSLRRPTIGGTQGDFEGELGGTRGNSGELRVLGALGADGRQAANSTKSPSANGENAKRQPGQETTSAGNSAGRSKCFIILEWEHQARGPNRRGWEHLEFYARRAWGCVWGGGRGEARRGEARRRAAA